MSWLCLLSWLSWLCLLLWCVELIGGWLCLLLWLSVVVVFVEVVCWLS